MDGRLGAGEGPCGMLARGMDLEEFRSFVAVVEMGSFLAAASALGVPRATLRRRVDALEARAGVLLLERSARGVVVTEAGSLLAARGRSVLQEASALVASVRELGREPVGVLRVLLPVGLPPHAMVPIFAALRRAYPRLALQTRVGEWSEGEVEIDLAIHLGAGGTTPSGPWQAYELLRLREWCLASADYLARRGTPTTIAELQGHELLAWAPPGEDGRVWPRRGGEPFEVEPALVSPDIHMIRQFVLAGVGIGFIPDALFPDPGVAAGTLVPVLTDRVGRERALQVLVPTALAGLPKVRAVVGHIQRFIAETRGDAAAR